MGHDYLPISRDSEQTFLSLREYNVVRKYAEYFAHPHRNVWHAKFLESITHLSELIERRREQLDYRSKYQSNIKKSSYLVLGVTILATLFAVFAPVPTELKKIVGFCSFLLIGIFSGMKVEHRSFLDDERIRLLFLTAANFIFLSIASAFDIKGFHLEIMDFYNLLLVFSVLFLGLTVPLGVKGLDNRADKYIKERKYSKAKTIEILKQIPSKPLASVVNGIVPSFGFSPQLKSLNASIMEINTGISDMRGNMLKSRKNKTINLWAGSEISVIEDKQEKGIVNRRKRTGHSGSPRTGTINWGKGVTIIGTTLTESYLLRERPLSGRKRSAKFVDKMAG